MIVEIITVALAAVAVVLLAANYFMRQRDVLNRVRRDHSGFVK